MFIFLKPVFKLYLSIGHTLFLLFELYVAVSYIKVKFMHNLPKLVPINNLRWAKTILHLFYFFLKKVRPTDPSDTSTQMKIFNRNFIVSFKSVSIFQTLISKYAKIYQQYTNKCYYFSICTLVSIKLFEAWSTVKSKKLSNQSDRNLQNIYFRYIKRILYVSRKLISKLTCVELKDVGTN